MDTTFYRDKLSFDPLIDHVDDAVYHLVRIDDGAHIYTSDYLKANHLVNSKLYEFVDVPWLQGTSEAVHMLVRRIDSMPLYTMNPKEIFDLTTHDYRYNGVAFANDSSKTVPIRKFRNQNEGFIVYSPNVDLVNEGFIDEGIVFYGKERYSHETER